MDMYTIQSLKKRSLFLVGLLVSGVVGLITNYFAEQYSRDGSLILPIAHADYTAYNGGDGGDGCGGCSGDSSY